MICVLADCGLNEAIKDGTILFNEDSDADGSLGVEITCDDGFEPPEKSVTCEVEMDSAGNVAVVASTPMCVVLRRRGCGVECYIPIIIVGSLILIILLVLLVLWWYCSRRRSYYPQKNLMSKKKKEAMKWVE